jgi:multisubunit Na+/H+ antiporter MnhC subunit
MALILAGIGLLVFMKADLIKGIALSLVIQSSIMLLLDFIAAARGDVYLKFLQSL